MIITIRKMLQYHHRIACILCFITFLLHSSYVFPVVSSNEKHKSITDNDKKQSPSLQKQKESNDQSITLPAGKTPQLTVQQKLQQMKARQSLKSHTERGNALQTAAAMKGNNIKKKSPAVPMHRMKPTPLATIGSLFNEKEYNETLQIESFDLQKFNSHTCGIYDTKPSIRLDPLSNETVITTPPGRRKFRIIVSSTEKYFDVFMNWLVFYYDSCPNIEHLYIICLDPIVEKQLPRYGLHCSYSYHLTTGGQHGTTTTTTTGGQHNRLWLIRARITKSLLDLGYDVLMCDVDAIWLHNPFPLIERYINLSHIISSRASFPEDVSIKLGATICMGFIYIKSAPTTQLLWNSIVINMSKQRTPDDQRTVNALLSQLGLKYTKRPSYETNKITNHGRLIHSNGLQLGITLLPHHLIRRLCNPKQLFDIFNSIIAHCLINAKKGNSKQIAEKMYGTWALKPFWRSVTFNKTLGMDYYLHQITGTRLDKISKKVLKKLENIKNFSKVSIKSNISYQINQFNDIDPLTHTLTHYRFNQSTSGNMKNNDPISISIFESSPQQNRTTNNITHTNTANTLYNLLYDSNDSSIRVILSNDEIKNLNKPSNRTIKNRPHGMKRVGFNSSYHVIKKDLKHQIVNHRQLQSIHNHQRIINDINDDDDDEYCQLFNSSMIHSIDYHHHHYQENQKLINIDTEERCYYVHPQDSKRKDIIVFEKYIRLL